MKRILLVNAKRERCDVVSPQLAQRARQYVLENWTWEKSAQELKKNLLSVIKNG